jgi:hypothetical protein
LANSTMVFNMVHRCLYFPKDLRLTPRTSTRLDKLSGSARIPEGGALLQ